ncbi:hypothetical protein SAMN05421856_105115 [Chryseobacterium taichungense]|uniref:Uncharacterized protein n=1 Tax=Chryseobacterium taichungense TaxID=295069 RepID=A0A1H8A505_9FLAO|nr:MULTISPECIES: hypothetical protein [Chryseobacterium]MDQ1858302.1 hypothetical protein [Chryseobacterium sp. WLY505]SEM65770.1 hypothetical protein SAMN05421856_105115 [Chryseobacterium taichungense]
MKQEKIIISLEAYNFHLFIHYLGEDIEVIKFDNFQSKFHRINIANLNYIDKITSDNNITEVNFYNNNLFALSDNKLLRLNLSNDFDKKIMFIDEEFDQLFLNKSSQRIDLLNTDNKINFFNANSTGGLKSSAKDIDIENDQTVTNMKSNNDNIYLSIRGYGVKEINKTNSNSFRTEDAQDLEILNRNNIIVIADAFEGLILFEINDKTKPIKKIRFENEIIQEVRLYQKMLLIKGKNGLYLYDYLYDKKFKIFEGSVGAVTSYYDMIFFTNHNKIHMISKENNSIKTFKLFKDQIEIQFSKIKKNF